MPAQHIKWRKQWTIKSDRVVWILIAKFDKLWRASESDDLYLKHGQGRHGTYEYLAKAIRNGTILGMPHISFYPDQKRISFTDGRHRIFWIRDHGGRAMPVTIHKSRVALARKLFGSRSRTCIVQN